MNFESMANRGLKIAYKKNMGKRTDLLRVLELDPKNR